jgi:hypothetical protein
MRFLPFRSFSEAQHPCSTLPPMPVSANSVDGTTAALCFRLCTARVASSSEYTVQFSSFPVLVTMTDGVCVCDLKSCSSCVAAAFSREVSKKRIKDMTIVRYSEL